MPLPDAFYRPPRIARPVLRDDWSTANLAALREIEAGLSPDQWRFVQAATLGTLAVFVDPELWSYCLGYVVPMIPARDDAALRVIATKLQIELEDDEPEAEDQD